MRVELRPTVVAADRFSDGILISFSDGRCGMYTAEFLYAALAECRELSEGAEPPTLRTALEHH